MTQNAKSDTPRRRRKSHRPVSNTPKLGAAAQARRQRGLQALSVALVVDAVDTLSEFRRVGLWSESPAEIRKGMHRIRKEHRRHGVTRRSAMAEVSWWKSDAPDRLFSAVSSELGCTLDRDRVIGLARMRQVGRTRASLLCDALMRLD